MELHLDPEGLAPDNKRGRIVDLNEVIRWLCEGRSDAWMCQEYERRYNMLTAPSTWRVLRPQVRRSRARHLAALLPWTIVGAHWWAYASYMLRMEADRRAGAGLSEDEAGRLETWRANLAEGDLVIDYDPDTEMGFSHVPRRPGIDRDLIRDPRRSADVGRGVDGVSDHRPMTDATERERAQRPEELERLVVERLNAGDVEGLVALYEPDAVLALPDGRTATGPAEIREAFSALVATGSTFELGDQRPALRSGDLALTSTRLDDGAVTVEVARRQPDGTWLFVVDQPNING